jgi:hypothetical protein
MIVRPTLPAGPYMVGVILKVEQDPSSIGPEEIRLGSGPGAVVVPGEI